jgi:hypothetical protein
MNRAGCRLPPLGALIADFQDQLQIFHRNGVGTEAAD